VTDLNFEYLVNAFLDLFLADKISIPELHHVRLLIEPEVARLAPRTSPLNMLNGLKRLWI